MRFVSVMLTIFIICLPGTTQEKSQKKSTAMQVPLPPLSHGGLTSLWYHDHKFLLDEYGEFELLNYKTAGFTGPQDSITAYSWKMLAIGDFLEKSISYATLARVKNNDKGILLIMFRWVDPADSTRAHGVFYRTFIGKDKLLLRVKQCTTGGVDTLEISCSDLKRRCAKCFYDTKKGQMVLETVDKD